MCQLLSYLIPSHPISSCFMLSYRFVSLLIISYLILSCPIMLSHPIFSHLILPFCIVSRRIRFFLIMWSHLIPPHPISLYLILFILSILSILSYLSYPSYLSLYLSRSLSLYLSIYLSICPVLSCLSVLSICPLCVRQSVPPLDGWLAVCLSVRLFLCYTDTYIISRQYICSIYIYIRKKQRLLARMDLDVTPNPATYNESLVYQIQRFNLPSPTVTIL